MVFDAQVVAEEKRAIANYRATDGAAEVVIGIVAARGVKIAARGERAHAVVFVRGAVKLVAARFQNQVYSAAGGAAELGVVVACGNIDGLNCFLRWNQDLKKAGTLVIVHSLELQVVRQTGLTIETGGITGLGIKEGRVLIFGLGGARHQHAETLKIVVSGQR